MSPPTTEGEQDVPKEPSPSSSSKGTGSTNIAGPSFAENSSKKFQDVDIEKILDVEVFAGTGRLTPALGDQGFRAMAVDKDRSRSKQVHIAHNDLEDPFQLEALLQLLNFERHSILWMHFTPIAVVLPRDQGNDL